MTPDRIRRPADPWLEYKTRLSFVFFSARLGANVTAIDPNEELLKIANSRKERYQLHNLQYLGMVLFFTLRSYGLVYMIISLTGA